MQLVEEVYRVTEQFPPDERFGLTQQIRRAAVSVPSNIAEGRGRGPTGDYRQFLLIARASLYEVQTQALIAASLEYLNSEESEQVVRRTEETIRVINGLLKYLAGP